MRAIRKTALLASALTLLAGSPAMAQTTPAADPADVGSIDAIVEALYASISGPAGAPRDWDRLRSLFLPEAKMIPVVRGPEGGLVARFVTVEEYIERSGPRLVEVGFREGEIARVAEEFGNIAHVFSTYEGFREGQEAPLVRGINSIQLFNDGERWWVANIYWQAEGPENPLPARYLPGAAAAGVR